MPKAKQKSGLPTRKVIAGVISIPIVTVITLVTGYEPSPEVLTGIITAVAFVVQYLIPPSTQDQIEEVITDVRDAQS